MKKSFFLISLLSISIFCRAQGTTPPEKQIVIGTIDSLFSNTLNEHREIWVQVPKRASGKEEDEKYPVIYVLDGTENFYIATGLIKLLSRWNLPESIIVGIKNTDRIRDFTPTNVPFNRGHESKTSGGASNFAAFIKSELAPYIKNKYPAGNMSTVIGHSTGGLFVIYSYLKHPGLFDNHLAIDPSLWWDKEQMVKESNILLKKDKYQASHLYIAVANSTLMDTIKVRESTSETTEALRANLKMHDIFVAHQESLDVTWEYFGEEDHGSIIIPGMYNGLRSLYTWFPFKERWRFNTPKAYSAKELTEPFYNHFAELSKRFKREVKPKWQFINDVGFFILDGHKLPKRALAYLEMNTKFYPNESRTYVALGDYHSKQKNKKQAIQYFKKAIEIDRNKDAIKKLEAINKK